MLEFFIILIALLGVFFLLGKTALIVIRHTDAIGTYFRIPQFLLGFVLLGFATSAPEFFIGVNATMLGTASVAVGNLFGGVFVLLSLLLGIVAVMNHGVTLSGLVSRPILLGVTLSFLAPIALVFDGTVSRLDGTLMIVAYIAATLLLAYEAYREAEESILRKMWSVITRQPPIVGIPPGDGADAVHQKKQPWRSFVWVMLGIIGLLVLTRVALELGLGLISIFPARPFVLGLLLFSIGTNLPELTLAISARRLGKQTLSLGNIIGSAMTNIALLGVLGVWRPITVIAEDSLHVALIFLFLALMLFFFTASTGGKITRREGMIHLALTVAFLATQFYLLWCSLCFFPSFF